ncbi:MAG: DMT family transporter [Bacteroidota bacterium]
MKAIVYFSLAAIFWGLNFHFAKLMLAETDFLEAGFWRFLFAVAPLFLWVIKDLPTWQMIRSNLVGISLIGVLGLFGFNLFFFLGMVNSPAINGALIINITPILTLLLSRMILKTPLQARQMLGVGISLLGVIFLITKGDLVNLTQLSFSMSDLLLLGASLSFAFQNIWFKQYGQKIPNRAFTFLTNLLCLICFALVLPFSSVGSSGALSASYWGAALGIGLLGTSVAYYFWNQGIHLSSANHASIYGNLIPLSTAFFSILLGERLFSYHWISGGIIILGVIVLQAKKQMPPERSTNS